MIPWDWNTTPQERAARFPCDGYLDTPVRRLTRAITITAPPPTVFRWLCQLKVAPYSYDSLDNSGRRSPRRLTPGAEQLAQGQPFLVFELVEFEPGQSLTGVVQPRFERIYGPLAGTYAIQPHHDGTSRLVARLDVGATTPFQRVRRALLAWGDLIMMRKQLLTLKQLAELAASPQQPPSPHPDSPGRPATGRTVLMNAANRRRRVAQGLYRAKRWMYRTGRPGLLGRAMNRVSAVQFSAGLLSPHYAVTLGVPGRRTGRLISFPVAVTEYQGKRYLVSMLGKDANWVRNVRAAGGQAVLRRRGRQTVHLEEVETGTRAPILRRYLAIAPAARPHIPVDRNAPLAEFERIAEQYPIFQITPATPLPNDN